MQSPARIILILAALATLLTAAGTFTRSWRTAEKGTRELNVGLRTWEECRKGECESATWSEVKGKAGKSTAATVGPLAFFVGIGAALVLALLAGAVMFSAGHVRLAGQGALVLSTAFLGLGLIYIMSFPTDFAPVGWSAYIGWLGAAVGIGAGVMSLKVKSAQATSRA